MSYDEHLISMAGGDGDSMADVLAAHGIYGMSAGTHSACRCNREWVLHAEYRAHLAAMLAAAGFGPVRETADRVGKRYAELHQMLRDELQAAALEEAADEFATGAWVDAFADFPVECDVTAVQATDKWLRARAVTVRGGE